jgi:sulfite reductase (NADPH) flavoprotein alpha-component
MRHPDSDFLYRDELTSWQAEGKLARLSLAVSRGAVRISMCRMRCAEATEVPRLIRQGAKHHGLRRARHGAGVSDALTEILARRADACDAESRGALCRRRLLT